MKMTLEVEIPDSALLDKDAMESFKDDVKWFVLDWFADWEDNDDEDDE